MTQADAQTGIEADRTLSFEALRERMIAELIGSGVLTDPAIEAAFRAVPREVFAPAGTPAELPYAINDVVETRFSEDGRILSSLSAPVMLLCTRACPVNALVTGLVMSGSWVLGVVS